MNLNQDEDQRKALGLVAALVTLIVAATVGMASYRAPHRAPAAATPAPVLLERGGVQVSEGVVTLYFASASAHLPDAADAALAQSVSQAQQGKTLVVSGFHDATGNPAANAELAKQRALAVRDALLQRGVVPERIQLEKPVMTEGEGGDAQARRVEVRAQ